MTTFETNLAAPSNSGLPKIGHGYFFIEKQLSTEQGLFDNCSTSITFCCQTTVGLLLFYCPASHVQQDESPTHFWMDLHTSAGSLTFMT
jgi:hypothetical protein